MRLSRGVRGIVPIATVVAISLSLAGCGGSAPGGIEPTATAPVATTPVSSPPTTATQPPHSPVIASQIVGAWHRTLICKEVRAAFAKYALLESHGDWACKEGNPPHAHSHFFTADGQFGSRDPGGQQVDDGDYVLVDADTLEFPSHEREFGYSPILVDFAVATNVTFTVRVPASCSGTCADAYAWALSAFGTNPWEPGEIP